MKNSFSLLTSLLIFSALFSSCSTRSLQVNSPDRTISVGFTLVDGRPQYTVTKNDKPVINPSGMGFRFLHGTDQPTRYKLLSAEMDSADEKWEQPWGEFRYIRDRHNELIVHLAETGGKKSLLDIHFRVFDDGVGFRYSFPEKNGPDSVVILDELTRFTFPADHQVWWIPVHSVNSYYESLYRKNPVSETDTINTPATFETADGLYLAIHEANLTDFASMTLRKTGSHPVYQRAGALAERGKGIRKNTLCKSVENDHHRRKTGRPGNVNPYAQPE